MTDQNQQAQEGQAVSRLPTIIVPPAPEGFNFKAFREKMLQTEYCQPRVRSIFAETPKPRVPVPSPPFSVDEYLRRSMSMGRLPPGFEATAAAARIINPFGSSIASPVYNPPVNPFGTPGISPAGTSGAWPAYAPGGNLLQTSGGNPTTAPGVNPFGTPSVNQVGTIGSSPVRAPGRYPTGTIGSSPVRGPFESPERNVAGMLGRSPFSTTSANPFETPGESLIGLTRLNSFGDTVYSPDDTPVTPFTTPPVTGRRPSFLRETWASMSGFPGSKTTAPLEYTMKVLNRVYEITSLVWRERLVDMAAPILRAPEFFRIHEAHCFNLGSIRYVIDEPWKEEESTPEQLATWLFTRMTQDEAIKAMVRYCVMLLFFEILTVNGATGMALDTDPIEGEPEKRRFAMYFNDVHLAGHDVYVLSRFSKTINDERFGDATVRFEVYPNSGTPTGAQLDPNGHWPNCHCHDRRWNHFLYVANGSYEGMAEPGSCRMPVNPAVILSDDSSIDHKHNQHCAKLLQVEPSGKDRMVVVPKTNKDGNPYACGSAVSDKIPMHIRTWHRYLKYCTHFRADGDQDCLTNAPFGWPPAFGHGDALYIRKDLSPKAVPFVDFS